jgi:aminoglycoside phosphotransferase (APT) family kinase protein
MTDVEEAARAAFGEAATIEPMAGGLSGAELYAIRAGGADYVARKTSKLRQERDGMRASREVTCMRIAAERGVAPRLVHVDAERGIVIMERIAGAPLSRGTPRDQDPLGRLAATLRTLHTGPAFPAHRSLAEHVQEFERALARHGAVLPPAIARIVAAVSPRVARYDKTAPCHNDVNPSNILATAERVYLVDWEASAAGDPFLDLGQAGICVCRDAAERDQLLELYLERAPTDDEREHMRVSRTLALAFYAAAFHYVAALQRLVPPPNAPTIDEQFAAMAAGGAVQPHQMATALVGEMVQAAMQS